MLLARRQLGDRGIAPLLDQAQAIERAQRLLAQSPGAHRVGHPTPPAAARRLADGPRRQHRRRPPAPRASIGAVAAMAPVAQGRSGQRLARPERVHQLGVTGQAALVADRPEPGAGEAPLAGEGQLRRRASRASRRRPPPSGRRPAWGVGEAAGRRAAAQAVATATRRRDGPWPESRTRPGARAAGRRPAPTARPAGDAVGGGPIDPSEPRA